MNRLIQQTLLEMPVLHQFAQVWIDAPLNRTFDYAIPAGMPTPQRGQLVTIPFGMKSTPRIGVVAGITSITDVPAAKIKSLIEIQDAVPAVSEAVLKLASFAADYYKSSLGEAIFAALPPAFKQLPLTLPKPSFMLSFNTQNIDDIPKAAKVQRAMFARLLALANQGTVDETTLLANCEDDAALVRDKRAIAALIVNEKISRSIKPREHKTIVAPNKRPALTPQQAAALETIDAATASTPSPLPWLLYGVTGSGKTEVYLRLIEQTIARGQQALLLVPEINLTPQLEARVRQRFAQQRIVTLHSSIAQGGRAEGWLAAAYGDADVVLGTRLAVFCPLPNLGLIIVDEEHDPSYKQQEGMRYSARDLALVRSHHANALVVLGSATPALESVRAVQRKRMHIARLTDRASSGATVPNVRVIDTRSIQLKDGLSKPLIAAIEERLQRGEQSLIFINRRGYAPTLYCRNCGTLTHCTRCSARMVWHRNDARLTCHHCGQQQPVPRSCEMCGSADLTAVGHGTQRLEDALVTQFPNARIERIDRDSTSRKGSFEAMIDRVSSNEIDILVGTQMLAKGHDFHGITLVGVIDADSALYATDMRAPERLFSSLLQVGGRSGRGDKPGEVLIQTKFPAHPLYNALKHHDFDLFAERELQERERHQLPPFTFMALLRAEAASMPAVMQFLDDAADGVRNEVSVLSNVVDVFNAVPATLQRKEDKWRAQLMIKSPSRTDLQNVLSALGAWLEAADKRIRSEKLRVVLDVDPSEV
jgi:primosomal protein N' (replication factor Y) (superfamily II helicase)